MRWRGRVAVVVVVVVVVVAGGLFAAGCKRPSRSSAEPWLELTVAVDRTSFAYQQGDRVVLHGAAGERRLRVGTGCLLGGSTLHIIGPSRVLALKQLVKGDPLDQHPERSSAPPCVLDFEARTARPAAELLPGLELEAGAEVVWGRSGNLYVQRRGEPRARVWKDGRLSPLELELSEHCDLVETGDAVMSACFDDVDGRTVLALRQLSLAGSPPRPIVTLHSDLPEQRLDVEARLSRDGRFVAVFGHIGATGPEPADESFLQVRDTATGELRFEQHEKGRTPSFIDVDFAPDGEALVALMQVNDSEGGSYRGEIWLQRYDLAGKATRLATAAPVQSYRVRWLADGQLMCERGPCPK